MLYYKPLLALIQGQSATLYSLQAVRKLLNLYINNQLAAHCKSWLKKTSKEIKCISRLEKKKLTTRKVGDVFLHFYFILDNLSDHFHSEQRTLVLHH